MMTNTLYVDTKETVFVQETNTTKEEKEFLKTLPIGTVIFKYYMGSLGPYKFEKVENSPNESANWVSAYSATPSKELKALALLMDRHL